MWYGSDALTVYLLNIADEAGWQIPADARGRMQSALDRFVKGQVVREQEWRTADLNVRKVAALLMPELELGLIAAAEKSPYLAAADVGVAQRTPVIFVFNGSTHLGHLRAGLAFDLDVLPDVELLAALDSDNGEKLNESFDAHALARKPRIDRRLADLLAIQTLEESRQISKEKPQVLLQPLVPELWFVRHLGLRWCGLQRRELPTGF
jgi:hypothetical protein